MSDEMTFQRLVDAVMQVHREMAAQAGRAVNLALTARNWLIGMHIAEFELRGADRADYGERVYTALAENLTHRGVSNCNRRQLYRYTRFYETYPWIVGALPAQFARLIPAPAGADQIVGATPPQLHPSPGKLLESLSYTHLEMIVDLDDDLKRAFYEIECIRGGWSTRELKRQIASLYYERSALSHDKEKLAELAQATAEKGQSRLAIRDPYVFEFLGLKPQEVVRESDFEEALLDRLQAFLLELGHGFCFEARQKRLLIGDTHGFVDLVFYHRILKCHVLIELKVDEFSHEQLGQLNTYVSWYRANVMTDGDNPPVGLLLCTEKDHVLVEYALAGIDNQLFVSKYQLELPSTADLRRFLEQQRREVEG
ncbi:MAG: PDDEXK nuclease domain-containing protein [Planctomycetota bacterium]